MASPEVNSIVQEQANDPRLWFLTANTESEAYLQQALRRLHIAIEDTPEKYVCVEKSIFWHASHFVQVCMMNRKKENWTAWYRPFIESDGSKKKD